MLEGIPAEAKLELMETLACDNVIIKHVVDQILEGWTENFYHGPMSCTAGDSPNYGLDWALREIAKRSGEVAKKEIERLEKALKETKENYWKLLVERSGNPSAYYHE